jgi:hypothetical protein
MPRSMQPFLVIAIACLSLAACDDRPLFQAPPRGGESISELAVSDSIITLVATLPYTTLAQATDAKMPKSVLLAGDGHVACMDVAVPCNLEVGDDQADCEVIRGARR